MIINIRYDSVTKFNFYKQDSDYNQLIVNKGRPLYAKR